MTPQHFWQRVLMGEPTECWGWTGSQRKKGYGTVHVNGRATTAHRYAYMLTVGPIPDGYQVDHLCGNPNCCNPTHLEAVTPRENLMRGGSPSALNARKTVCKRGHPLSGDNLRIDGTGRRNCRTCRRETQRARRRAAA